MVLRILVYLEYVIVNYKVFGSEVINGVPYLFTVQGDLLLLVF